MLNCVLNCIYQFQFYTFMLDNKLLPSTVTLDSIESMLKCSVAIKWPTFCIPIYINIHMKVNLQKSKKRVIHLSEHYLLGSQECSTLHSPCSSAMSTTKCIVPFLRNCSVVRFSLNDTNGGLILAWMTCNKNHKNIHELPINRSRNYLKN